MSFSWEGALSSRFLRIFEKVDGVYNACEILPGDMEVHGGGMYSCMSQETLDMVEIGSRLQEVCGKTVSEGVDRCLLFDP